MKNVHRILKKQTHQSQIMLESESSKINTAKKHKQTNSQILSPLPSTDKQNSQYQSPYVKHHQHTRTLQIDRSQESQFYSDDSENDLFRDTQKEEKKTTIHHKSRSKILNQMAYITQKMMPDYEKGMLLISQAENKITNYGQNEQESLKIQIRSTLNYGETPIYYSIEKHPIELLGQVWNVMEVHQMEFYYYKIRSKGQPIPFQFYMNNNLLTNFKIFVSSINPFPTKFSCDQVFSVKGWKYKGEDQKQFSNEYIYLSIVCDLDNQVKLKFQFGNEYVRKVQSNSKPKNHPEQIERMSDEMLKNEIAEIKKRRKLKYQQLCKGAGRNIIKLNITNVPSHSEEIKKSFRQFKKYQFDSRIEDVIERRKHLDITDQQQKEIKLTCKELQRVLRQHQLMEQQKKQYKNRLSINWLNILYMAMIGQKILLTFQHKVETIKHSRLMAFQVKRIMRRMHNRLCATKGVTLQDRVFFDTKLCLNAFCNAIYAKQEKILVQNSIPVLKIRANFYNFKVNLMLTISKIAKIKSTFKEFMIRYFYYKDNLNNVWLKHFQEQFNKVFKLIAPDQESQYQLWFQAAQVQPIKEQIQLAFIQLYSKDKMKIFLRQIHQYSRALKSIKSDKFKKSNQNLFSDVRNIKKPRLFLIPTSEDIFSYIPKVYQITQQLLHPRQQKHATYKSSGSKKY